MRYYYSVQGTLHYFAQLPKVAKEVRDGIIAGTLETESVDITRWKEPPHRRLADLPRIHRPGFEVVDPKAIQLPSGDQVGQKSWPGPSVS